MVVFINPFFLKEIKYHYSYILNLYKCKYTFFYIYFFSTLIFALQYLYPNEEIIFQMKLHKKKKKKI